MSDKTKTVMIISEHGDPASTEIGSEGAGGQNVYVRAIGETLGELGWRVDMFTRKTGSHQQTIVEHSPQCRTIRVVVGPLESIDRNSLFSLAPEFVQRILDFMNAEGDLSYSIIHSNYWISGWIGLQLSKILGIPIVHTNHSLGVIKYENESAGGKIPHPISVVRIRIEQEILERANCTIATSCAENRDLLTRVSTREGNVTRVIPCGVDLSVFKPLDKSECRKKIGIETSVEKIILYVGRFEERKGIETLVKAYAQYMGQSETEMRMRTKLYLIGGFSSDFNSVDGREAKRIKYLIQNLGIESNVIFTGRLDHSILSFYYGASDLVAVPSYYEPFGLTAIEAMASGRTVIASSVGGLQTTVVHGETGLICPPKDVDAFASALEIILNDPNDLAERMGTNGRKRVEKLYGWKQVANAVENLYMALISGEEIQ